MGEKGKIAFADLNHSSKPTLTYLDLPFEACCMLLSSSGTHLFVAGTLTILNSSSFRVHCIQGVASPAVSQYLGNSLS